MSARELDPDGTDSYHPQHPWEQVGHPEYVYPNNRTKKNWPPVDFAVPAGRFEQARWAALPSRLGEFITPTAPIAPREGSILRGLAVAFGLIALVAGVATLVFAVLALEHWGLGFAAAGSCAIAVATGIFGIVLWWMDWLNKWGP